jgi:hypothetical protein
LARRRQTAAARCRGADEGRRTHARVWDAP